MQRCLQLAIRGIGAVAPNPMVGAVLVNEGRIIGEGFHEKYGGPHAEVNCINSVAPQDVPLISNSTLFVSLEPCSHFGKTPPCTDLVFKNKIARVLIGCTDSFYKVNGIEKLRTAGIHVIQNVLQPECRKLNKRFFTFHEKKRPYIILKWAQSNNQKIAGISGKTVKISNDYTKRLVHKWRTEEAAILAGAKTVLNDDPYLTARKWPGKNPVRVIIDPELKTLPGAKIFNDDAATLIINTKKNETPGSNIFLKPGADKNLAAFSINCLYEKQLNSVIIEGGAKTLQFFIDAGLWDEARVITNSLLEIARGIAAPELRDHILIESENLFTDRIDYYKQRENGFL